MTHRYGRLYRQSTVLVLAIILLSALATDFEWARLWLPTTAAVSALVGALLLLRLNATTPSDSESDASGPSADLLDTLSNASSRNAIAATEVSFAINGLTTKLDNQVKAITQIQSNASGITATVQEAAEHTRTAGASSSRAREISELGRSGLQAAIEEMRHINQRAATTLTQIESLDSKIHHIQDVTKVIEAIASQTNLLALNAAIEAARAGEHGRGFAVVADEVRQLAARTADSTNEVGQIVEDILGETRRVVADIKQLSQDVDLGTTQVAAVGDQLEGIADQSRAVEEQIHAIAEGSAQNRLHLDQILTAITDVQQELTASEHQMEHLAEQAAQMMEMAEESNALLAEHSEHSDHQAFYRLAEQGKAAIEAAFEQTINAGKLGERDLFDRDYQPIAGTSPQKYRTRYDQVCDQLLPAIQEPLLQQNNRVVYAIANDNKGYVPTHNQAFSKPLTGDYDTDFAGNRTKRLFNDRTGIRCATHTNRMLVQTYKRDTGEVMHDLSVPLFVRGKHWGSLRIGYRPLTA